MKSVVSGFLVAFSLYSAIPVPQVNWEKKTMRWALSFLPLVGLLIGAAQWLWFWFCAKHGAAGLFYAVGAMLLPLVLSGGIHLDGFTDTCDALCSHADREKKLQIMKDPHVGAFGPLWLAAFLLAETACFAQLYQKPALLPFALTGFALARALGGREIVALPCAKESGLAHLFAEGSDKKAVAATLLLETAVLFAAAVLWLRASPGGVGAVCVGALILLAGYWRHGRLCRDVFGGITGDLAGFFISLAELFCLFFAAVGGLLL